MAWFDDLKTPRIKTPAQSKVSKVPEGIWTKCPDCGEIQDTKRLQAHHQVCPECQYHFRMTAAERIELFTDSGSDDTEGAPQFEEFSRNLASTDPLEFNDLKPYKQRIVESVKKSKTGDAVRVGKALLGNLPYYLGIMDFKFMGGSMGVVVGEKLADLFERAIKNRLPVVIVSSSGGARMQEGILSLMQMAKTSALVDEFRKARLPYISVLTDPTTGGVAASFSMLGDVIIAEPKALIGFAGPRVIQQTIRQSLPPGFQRSEFLLEHGFVDRVVHRKDLANEVREWMLRLGRHTCRFPKDL